MYVKKFVTIFTALRKTSMKTQSIIKSSKAGGYEYIMIYYSVNKAILRINTRNITIKNGMTKDLLYKNSVVNYEELNERTVELKRRVDDYIRIQLASPQPRISQKDCLSYIDDSNYQNNRFTPNHLNKNGKYFRIGDYKKQPEAPPKTVNDYYTDFFIHKQQELRNRVGWKDYKSLQNALLDYQTFYKKPLTFKVMDSEEFLISFRNFLMDEHPLLTTKGGMNDNTVNKRIIAVKTFWKWLKRKKSIQLIQSFFCSKHPHTTMMF